LAEIIIRVVVVTVAVLVAIRIVPGAQFSGEPWQLVVFAAIVGVINAYIRPIVVLLSLPLRLLSFGLIGLVINTGLLMLAAAVGDSLQLGFTLGGWPPGPIELDTLVAAFLTALLISIVSAFMALLRFATPRA